MVRFSLSTIHIYWTSIYILSQTVIQAIDHLIQDFFWNQWRSRRYLHAIAWDFMSTNSSGRPRYSIYSWPESSCYASIYSIYSAAASLGWRGILSLRHVVLPYIQHLIGDGRHSFFVRPVASRWSSSGYSSYSY